MDLGLKNLTDDQAVELLQEVLQDLAQRDPVVRNIAQSAIFTESEKLDLLKNAAEDARNALKQSYVNDIERQVFDEIKRGVAAGEISLVSSREEAELVKNASIDARIKLIDEAITELRKGQAIFWFEVRERQITVSLGPDGSKRLQINHRLDTSQISKLAHVLRAVLVDDGGF